MGANNTPMPDLIELSSIYTNATFTTATGGGGDIVGVVDNATYTDGDSSNSATHIAELNETYSGNGGTITIDGVDYAFTLAVPDSSLDDVTVTYNDGASSVDLAGSGGSSEVVFIQASPIGGGATRYFMAVDDGVGDLPDISSIQIRDLDFVSPICFTPGTFIETLSGPRDVEDLSVGDLILTAKGAPRPIRWVGKQEMVFCQQNARHRPIEIKAHALGVGMPASDLVVSPQHRFVLSGPEVEEMFGATEVLAPAKGLTALPGVRVKRGLAQVRYCSLLLDRHEVIIANGARTESLYPGRIALKRMSRVRREVLEEMFPGLSEDPKTAYGPPARRVLTRQEAETLVARVAAGWARRICA